MTTRRPDGTLDPSSRLVSTVTCLKAQGTTATAPGIDKAQQVLAANHDPEAQDAIIFLTDGEANYGPCTDSNGDQNCEQLVTSTARGRVARPPRRAGRDGGRDLGLRHRLRRDRSVECWGWRSEGTGTDGKSCNKKNGFQFR